MKKTNTKVRRIAFTALLGAVATVLMAISFSVPFMPSFIKFDLSELPALLAAFAFGPVSGVAVCLIKNLINLMFTTTAGIGELCNFLLGCCLVLPSGIIYKFRHNRLSAFVSSSAGALVMALASIPTNYFITYPFYFRTVAPESVILGAYRAIFPETESILQALVMFNAPYTFVKGMISVFICFIIYKKLSPILKGDSK